MTHSLRFANYNMSKKLAPDTYQGYSYSILQDYLTK